MTIQERKDAILAKIAEIKAAGINPQEAFTKSNTSDTNENQETI